MVYLFKYVIHKAMSRCEITLKVKLCQKIARSDVKQIVYKVMIRKQLHRSAMIVKDLIPVSIYILSY